MLEYIVREMNPSEYPLLKNFLYEAIFQKEETNLLPKSIINEPSLKIYIENFGAQPHDYCLLAEINKNIVGAVWVRAIPGFGHIGNDIPEFAISLYKQYRNQGIGNTLMKKMIAFLRQKGYHEASLAVQKKNYYALKMYENLGFCQIAENEEEYIMKYLFH